MIITLKEIVQKKHNSTIHNGKVYQLKACRSVRIEKDGEKIPFVRKFDTETGIAIDKDFNEIPGCIAIDLITGEQITEEMFENVKWNADIKVEKSQNR